MVLKYSRKRQSVYMFILNCTKGNLKTCNCCLYIGSLLLINPYVYMMERSRSWESGFHEHLPHGPASVPNTGPVRLASAKRLQNMRQVDGVAVPARRATCCSCWRHAEFLHQVAALVHYFQWRPARAEIKLVNSIGI